MTESIMKLEKPNTKLFKKNQSNFKEGIGILVLPDINIYYNKKVKCKLHLE